jgi:hypothetical protein
MGTVEELFPAVAPADVAPRDFVLTNVEQSTITVRSQEAHPAATGTNRVAGSLVLCTGLAERLRITGDGKFYVNGRLLTTDLDVYEAARRFFTGTP